MHLVDRPNTLYKSQLLILVSLVIELQEYRVHGALDSHLILAVLPEYAFWPFSYRRFADCKSSASRFRERGGLTLRLDLRFLFRPKVSAGTCVWYVGRILTRDRSGLGCDQLCRRRCLTSFPFESWALQILFHCLKAWLSCVWPGFALLWSPCRQKKFGNEVCGDA